MEQEKPTPPPFNQKQLWERALTEAMSALSKPADSSTGGMEIERAKALISLAATIGSQV